MRPGELKLKRLYVPRILSLDSKGEIFSAISDWYNGRDQYFGDLGPEYRKAVASGIQQGFGVDRLVQLETELLRNHLAPGNYGADPQVFAFKEVGGRLEMVLLAARLLFPRLKIVLIVRSPMAVSSAIYRSRRRQRQSMGLRCLVQQAVEPWQVLLSQMHLFGAPGIFFLSYEALVRDPQAVAVGLERYLSLEPGSLHFHETTLFGRSVTSRTASVDTSRVFVSNAFWMRGLHFAEILIVILSASYFRLRLFGLASICGLKWKGYGAFAREIDRLVMAKAASVSSIKDCPSDHIT
jgi:hypothetical protein